MASWWVSRVQLREVNFGKIDLGAALTKEDLIRRSMPNLNHPTKLRLPNPGSAMSSNLNRLHGSDSGLRPPLVHQSSQLPVGQVLNGSQLRPQLRPPQSSSSVAMNVDCQSAAGKTTNALVRIRFRRCALCIYYMYANDFYLSMSNRPIYFLDAAA